MLLERTYKTSKYRSFVLKERGKILSIEKEIDDNKWEIWLKIGKEVFAYYLFPCDDWVIEC